MPENASILFLVQLVINYKNVEFKHICSCVFIMSQYLKQNSIPYVNYRWAGEAENYFQTLV